MVGKIIESFKRGILGDVIFKLIANVVQTIIRNIIVLPMLAKYFTNSEYGELVTVVGVITTIAAGLGNSLLSARLVMEADYKHKNIQGDFNRICWSVSALSLLGTPIIALLFPGQSFGNLIVIACILFLETYIGYQSGWFILKQAYRMLLVYTLVGGIGFGIGLLLTKVSSVWPYTYLCSDVASFIFLFKLSPLVRESNSLTQNLKITLQKYGILIITTIIANALAYMDRLLLYPSIGSEAVAIYTTASVFGKAFNLIALPVSSIMLGYYATEKIKLNRKKYWLINGGMLLCLFIFVILTRIAGKWFTGILYPRLIQQAEPYIFIANLSSAIGATAQITKSAALKYAKTHWTLIIQTVYALAYIGLGLLWAKKDGLLGFSYAVLIANVTQICLLYIVCHNVLREGSDNAGHTS
jgi:O-antigen/teichoic acid export membrane protein